MYRHIKFIDGSSGVILETASETARNVVAHMKSNIHIYDIETSKGRMCWHHAGIINELIAQREAEYLPQLCFFAELKERSMFAGAAEHISVLYASMSKSGKEKVKILKAYHTDVKRWIPVPESLHEFEYSALRRPEIIPPFFARQSGDILLKAFYKS